MDGIPDILFSKMEDGMYPDVVRVRSGAEIVLLDPGFLLVPADGCGKGLHLFLYYENFHCYGFHKVITHIRFRIEGKGLLGEPEIFNFLPVSLV